MQLPLLRLARLVVLVVIATVVVAAVDARPAAARAAPSSTALLTMGGDVGGDTTPPRRPRLADTADTRDWRAYFRCAMRAELREEEQACLYWAERLDPEAPETPYLRYLLSDEKDTASATRARLYEPFFFHTRIITIESKGGVLTPPVRRGWLALRSGDYFAASGYFSRHLARTPRDPDARWGAAIADHYRGRNDSAAMHLVALVEAVRAEQDKHTASYLSLEFAEYATGTAYRLARDHAAARAALERALTENLAFFPARMLLGDLALESGDTTVAIEHWASVPELARGDIVARARYARFLIKVGRAPDAERELRELVAAEPHWVNARRDLALAVDLAGDSRRQEALRVWEDYLARAPAQPAAQRAAAELRVAALRGG